LKEHLTEDIDFALVPEPVWKLLFQWYQLAPGQEPIARKVHYSATKLTEN
jgi:ubiquitin carboxyl-terminal hydrolase 4/11/15